MTVSAILQDIAFAPKVLVGAYVFSKYSFGEEGTYLSPEILCEIGGGLIKLCADLDCDYFTTLEPGGVQFGSLTALHFKKGLRIIRANAPRFSTPDQLVKQRTGYCRRGLFLDGYKCGDKTVIIDDVISTGSTLEVVLDHLLKWGVIVNGVVCIYRKGNDNLEKYRLPIRSIVPM